MANIFYPWIIGLSMDIYVTHSDVVFVSWTKFHDYYMVSMDDIYYS